MTFPDYAMLAGYLLLLASIGLFVRRLSSDISDYFRAGCRGTWWLVGTSVFMQGFSALAFTGISGQAFLGGWSVLTIFWSNALVYFVHAAFFAAWLRQTRAITPGDAVRERFGPVTEQVFVYYSTIGGLIWGGVLLLALATFTSVIFGLPLQMVIVGVGCVMILYSVIGGSWSVFTADSLQAMVLIPVTIVLAGLSLRHLGGVDGLFAEIERQGLTADFAFIKPAGHEYAGDFPLARGLFTLPWTLAMLFNGVLNAFNMTGCYRYLAVKTGNEARKAALLAGVLMLLGSVVWLLPPLTTRLSFAADVAAIEGLGNKADAAYAIAALKLLPAGLLGLVVLAMFAASMSTIDSALTGTAALIVKNIYPPLQRIGGWRERSSSDLLRMSKWINGTLGITVVGLAFYINYIGGQTGLFGIMLQILILIAAPLSLPFACALFIRRIPHWAALFAMGTGLTASLGMTLATKLFGVQLMWSEQVWIMALAIIPPFFLTFFLRRTSAPAFYRQVDAFFTKIKTPIDFEREVGADTDLSQLRLTGRLGLVLGLLVSSLLLVSTTFVARSAVSFIAGYIFALSSLMCFLGRRPR